VGVSENKLREKGILVRGKLVKKFKVVQKSSDPEDTTIQVIDDDNENIVAPTKTAKPDKEE
jgi:hypothetical protein